MNGEIQQEKERSVEKTKETGTVRETNKERSERKSAGRQQQQQTTVVGELSNSKSTSASKSGVANVTSTSESKRDVLSGYVSMLAPVITVSAWRAVEIPAYQTVNSFVTSEPCSYSSMFVYICVHI